MTTNAEIRDQLEAIDTGIYYTNNDEKKELKMDNFSSFTYCKDSLPSNDELQKMLDENRDEFTPTNVRGNRDFSFDDSFFEKKGEFNNNYMFLGLNVAARSTDKTDENGKKVKGINLAGWKNFHDMEKPKNTCKMYVQLNEEKFQGCYITDLIKNSVNSNAGDISRNFFLEYHKDCSFNYDSDEAKNKRFNLYHDWFQNNNEEPEYSDKEINKMLKDNNKTFNRSLDIFIQECNIIKPKRLVAFGNPAYHALETIKESDAIKKNDAQNDKVNISELIDNALWLYHYANQIPFVDWFEKRPYAHVSISE